MQILRKFEAEGNTTENIKATLIELIDSTINSHYAEFKVNSTTSSQKEDV